MNNFFKRLLTSIVFVSVLLGSIAYHPVTFILLTSAIALLGLIEFYNLASVHGAVPQKWIAVIAGTAFVMASGFTAYGKHPLSFLLYFVPVLFLVFFIELFRPHERPYENIAWTILGWIYICASLSLFAFVAFLGNAYHPNLIMGLFFILWAHDTGAYLSGMAFGKHRLYEKISPKKSWEGSAGGMLSAILLAWILSYWFPEIDFVTWASIAVIFIVAGTLGDLSESQFKRSTGVKDSGNLLPGHGGILDRFDALFLAIPFVFFYLALIRHFPS